MGKANELEELNGRRRKPNRLIHETSPYLLQHAHNPVHWYPWGPEALEQAKREDKPLLLSIGYSACHWCHVMEHESFEDEDTARLMNELFVNIKVDREERPDLDSIYMKAVQAMTGHGGWPMTVFLTPEGEPFYGGTYFPDEPRHGMPSFRQVLDAVADAYRSRRGDIAQNAARLRTFLQAPAAPRQARDLTPDVLDRAYRNLAADFDSVYGGFGRAPKFPQPMNLEFLLRYVHRTESEEALRMVELTLERMAQGGMYDQLGGGFHRYSTDAHWLVPHFEKMLYDNALLSRVYLEAYQATDNPFYRRVATETLDYVHREMTSPEGGFYSTQDADSEGEEGKFYVWQRPAALALLTSELGADGAALFCRHYDIGEHGNWEGKNILHVPRPLSTVAREAGVAEDELEQVLERGRRILLEARSLRVWPGRDDKVLTAWNGLMLRSFGEAARVLDRGDYGAAAEACAVFLLTHLRRDGRLRRTYKDDQAKLNGYLEDYAFLADGLLALYEATFDRHWLDEAAALMDVVLERFADEPQGGFYDTSDDHEALVARPKDIYDNATPSGNSVAAGVLLRLSVLLGEERYRRPAMQYLEVLAEPMAGHPGAFGRLLCALDFGLGPVKEIAIVGDPAQEDTQALLAEVYGRYLSNKVVVLKQPGEPDDRPALPLLAEREQLDGKATAYVCEHYTCQLPVTDPTELGTQLAA